MEPDINEALKWFKAAAEQGDASAQYNLALLYEGVEDIPRDYGEALHWYKLAAKQGDAAAQNSVALFYDQAMGVPQDVVEAVKWYRLAAEEGDASAQFNLGIKYETGTGVEPDPDEAAMWYQKAAGQGHVTARNNLLLMNEHEISPDEQRTIIGAITRQQSREKDQPLAISIDLSERAAEISQRTVLAPDWLVLFHRCKECEVYTPAIAIINSVPYRNMAEFLKTAIILSRQAPGGAAPACTACGGETMLDVADYHSYHSAAGKDLVVRYSVSKPVPKGLGYWLLWWHPDEGYTTVRSMTDGQVNSFSQDADLRNAAHQTSQ